MIPNWSKWSMSDLQMSPIPKIFQDQFHGLDFSYDKMTLVSGTKARAVGILGAGFLESNSVGFLRYKTPQLGV